MEQKEVWNNIALPWNEFRTEISPTVEKFLKEQKGKILDVGCGSGRNFMRVDGLSWYGIDFSEKMIEFAEKDAKEKNLKVNLKVCDSTALPFENDFFDAVLCFAVIHCVDSAEKRKKTVEEIYRVLKTGGTALIATWGPESPRLKGKPKESYVPWTVSPRDDSGEPRDGVMKQLRYTYVFDLKELVELCKDVGFEIVNSWEERNVNVIVRKV